MTWPEPSIDPKDVPVLLELCAGDREALEALVRALAETLPAQHSRVPRSGLPD